jgi:hypothetical protein
MTVLWSALREGMNIEVQVRIMVTIVVVQRQLSNRMALDIQTQASSKLRRERQNTGEGITNTIRRKVVMEDEYDHDLPVPPVRTDRRLLQANPARAREAARVPSRLRLRLRLLLQAVVHQRITTN